MKRLELRPALMGLALVLVVFSCRENDSDQPDPEPEKKVEFVKPPHFPEPLYNLSTNPVTKAGFELGRALFYEPMFSRDNSISCGSCHLQSSAFTQHGHSLSHGIDDRIGFRNSQPIMNLAWHKTFMWDGGVINLDLFPPAPVHNPVEMDETMNNVLKKLRNSGKYGAMYQKAFGTDSINFARTVQAMSQFMLMCTSADSPYDQWRLGKGSLSQEAQEGYELVKSKCGNCHAGELFTDDSFRNNGIGNGRGRVDFGRYHITLNEEDKFKFKVPSLRNLTLTAPYMHDGRFFTLEAVLDHYSSGVKITQNLDSSLVKNGSPGIALSPDEKSKIITFLRQLDDKTFQTRPDLSEAAVR